MFTMSFIQFTSDSNGECDAGKQGDVQKYLGHYLYPCSAEQVTVIHKKSGLCFQFFVSTDRVARWWFLFIRF